MSREWVFVTIDGGKTTQDGERGGEVQKKNARKGKLNEKNSCTQINPKKVFML